MTDAILSAAAICGEPVVSDTGEPLGKIEDFVLDLQSGRVRYAVLSFGGLLGVGAKLFAVPPEALRLGADALVLAVDKVQLENAPGFDRDQWPDFADAALGARIYGYYGRQPYWM